MCTKVVDLYSLLVSLGFGTSYTTKSFISSGTKFSLTTGTLKLSGLIYFLEQQNMMSSVALSFEVISLSYKSSSSKLVIDSLSSNDIDIVSLLWTIMSVG